MRDYVWRPRETCGAGGMHPGCHHSSPTRRCLGGSMLKVPSTIVSNPGGNYLGNSSGTPSGDVCRNGAEWHCFAFQVKTRMRDVTSGVWDSSPYTKLTKTTQRIIKPSGFVCHDIKADGSCTLSTIMEMCSLAPGDDLPRPPNTQQYERACRHREILTSARSFPQAVSHTCAPRCRPRVWAIGEDTGLEDARQGIHRRKVLA